jgi:hypothetical protein
MTSYRSKPKIRSAGITEISNLFYVNVCLAYYEDGDPVVKNECDTELYSIEDVINFVNKFNFDMLFLRDDMNNLFENLKEKNVSVIRNIVGFGSVRPFFIPIINETNVPNIELLNFDDDSAYTFSRLCLYYMRHKSKEQYFEDINRSKGIRDGF